LLPALIRGQQYIQLSSTDTAYSVTLTAGYSYNIGVITNGATTPKQFLNFTSTTVGTTTTCYVALVYASTPNSWGSINGSNVTPLYNPSNLTGSNSLGILTSCGSAFTPYSISYGPIASSSAKFQYWGQFEDISYWTNVTKKRSLEHITVDKSCCGYCNPPPVPPACPPVCGWINPCSQCCGQNHSPTWHMGACTGDPFDTPPTPNTPPCGTPMPISEPPDHQSSTSTTCGGTCKRDLHWSKRTKYTFTAFNLNAVTTISLFPAGTLSANGQLTSTQYLSGHSLATA